VKWGMLKVSMSGYACRCNKGILEKGVSLKQQNELVQLGRSTGRKFVSLSCVFRLSPRLLLLIQKSLS